MHQTNGKEVFSNGQTPKFADYRHSTSLGTEWYANASRTVGAIERVDASMGPWRMATKLSADVNIDAMIRKGHVSLHLWLTVQGCGPETYPQEAW